MKPSVSVVMPVLNAEPFLNAAISSILNQTFVDFELIIFDDGSSDGSLEQLREWGARDDRIRLFSGQNRLGPVGSSNRVVQYARAPIIARMDADDVSHPERLERQFFMLQKNSDVVLVGSVCETIDETGRLIRPADRGRLSINAVFPPFAHSTIAFRAAAFATVGGYRQGCDWWEDIDLYFRLAKLGRVMVHSEPLCKHRITRTGTRASSNAEAVLQAYSRLYAVVAGYDTDPTIDEKIAPSAFPLLGSVALWAGHRPKLLSLLLRRGRMEMNWSSIQSLAWTLWAECEPFSLRWALRSLLTIRNWRARHHLQNHPWIEWRPPLDGRSGLYMQTRKEIA